MSRLEEISANLAVVRRRIADAAAGAQRSADEVELVVVTKFFPAEDVRILGELGVRHVGESRHQEAEAKHDECVASGLADLTWHFIGSIQSNKATAIARYADVVESLDRIKVANALQRGAAERGRPLDVLLQVSLDPPESEHRGGAAPGDLPALVDQVLAAPDLRLRGVMGVAPLGQDPLPAFEQLAARADDVRRAAPEATWISAGMSADLEDAVKCGATHVRIGSAVLGSRPAVK